MDAWATHVSCQRSNLTGPALKWPDISIQTGAKKEVTTETKPNADQDKPLEKRHK